MVPISPIHRTLHERCSLIYTQWSGTQNYWMCLTIPAACLPRVGNSSEVYGHTRGLGFLPDGIPVAGVIGDQQGALFGQACFEEGMAKCTYGTGAFILLNTGDTPKPSEHGMLTTVAWQLEGTPTYALEGSAFIAGAAVQWIRDGLGLIEAAEKLKPSQGRCRIRVVSLLSPRWLDWAHRIGVPMRGESSLG